MYAIAGLPLANLSENIGSAVVNILAVAGAGAVGFFLTWLGLTLAGKLLFNQQLPKSVTRLVSVIGGVALALLVGALLFRGAGGGGWGFGPGFGFGTGSNSTNGDQKVPDQSSPKDKAAPTQRAGDPSAAPLKVLMLGGTRVKGSSEDEMTYYQVQPDGSPANLTEIKKAIRSAKGAAPPIREIVIIIEPESVAHNHPAVKRLEDFAKDERLAISYIRSDKRE